jgi:hypothetical protein
VCIFLDRLLLSQVGLTLSLQLRPQLCLFHGHRRTASHSDRADLAHPALAATSPALPPLRQLVFLLQRLHFHQAALLICPLELLQGMFEGTELLLVLLPKLCHLLLHELVFLGY